MLQLVIFLVASITLVPVKCNPTGTRPNIVIIQVDDMGSYDASYHGSNQFLTPNIDALAYNGVILNRFYTPPMCTPSRSSVMTGKDSHNLGMQHFVILPHEPWGLGFDDKLISNYFQDAGYSTHLVGKWHLGNFQKKYTPTLRGFDTFYGYYNGMIDYWSREFGYGGYSGYDFRRNLDVWYDVKNGSYATDLFTDETVDIILNQKDKSKPFFLMLNHLAPHAGCWEALQVSKEDEEKFSFIEDKYRRRYAAMVSKADESVGKVVSALEESGALGNTIILFYSDNGAPTIGIYSNHGSNHPLRGIKASPWEGATRNLGFVYSPLIKKNQRVHEGYFHTADVLPTLTSAAGIKVSKVDGFDQWDVLVNGGKSPRNDVVNSMDTVYNQYGFISGNYKLVASDGKGQPVGSIEEFQIPDASYANSVLSSTVSLVLEDFNFDLEHLTTDKIIKLRNEAKIQCNEDKNPDTDYSASKSHPVLFDIINDPCERTDLAKEFPLIVDEMWMKMKILIDAALPSRRRGGDSRCDPKLHNGTWTWWIPDEEY